MEVIHWISLLIWLISVYCVASDLCSDRGEPVTQFDINNADNPSVFDDLTTTEIRDVYAYMRSIAEFNVQDADQVTVDSTYVNLIERLPAPKAEALAFLDGTGTKPVRYAKVILYRGDLPRPVVEEYKVGPLPNIEGHRRIQINGKDQIEYRRRQQFAPADYLALDALVRKETAAVDYILNDITGYTLNNCTTKCLVWLVGLLGEYKAGGRSIWINLLRKEEGFYLHPIGLQFRVVSGDDVHPENWFIDFVWFRGKSYNSLNDMVENVVLPTTKDKPIDSDTRNLYSTLNHRGTPLPEHKQRGPASFMPDGRRYTVDNHHVEWQGWKFDFNLRSVIGLQVHDLQFKNERIAYELSLSEFGVLYSGSSPLAQHSLFADSPFYFGLETFELISGVDCPAHATFFYFAHYFNFKPLIFKNSACLFEHNNRMPLRHHYESDFMGSYNFIQGMPGNVLVLRCFIAVYNYDYMFDYVFHQNGAVEVSVTLGGYILSSYHTGSPEDDRYGFEVFPDGYGQIHNHILHLKADLDIINTNNRFETLDIGHEQIPNPTDNSQQIFVQKFYKNLRQTEKEAALKYNFDTPKYLVFHNNNEVNKYGNKRGYRLYPVNVNKQILPENWTAEKGVSWTRNMVAVTKQKDEEQRAGSIYNNADMLDPVVSFQDYIDDDESIVDEDLVAWITMGVFHIPHSEDIPIVQTPGLSLTYFLLPFNFYDEDPSLASRDNVKITPNADGTHKFEYAGDPPPDVGCEKLKYSALTSSAARATTSFRSAMASLFVFVVLYVTNIL